MSTLQAAIDKHKERVFELNRFLVENPELSGKEFKACEKYEELLRGLNFPIKSQFCGLKTAFHASIKEVQKPKARFALLSEYDALPGIGHGCGHSASGAISLLAALALSELNIDANIDLIGTPDEELGSAKITMCSHKAFLGYDLAAMIHLASNTTNPSMGFLALGLYEIHFKGKPAHASASPWEGANALNAAMLCIHALDMLRGHMLPSSRLSSIITQGGDAHNIVPERASIKVCMRANERAYLAHLRSCLENCAKGAALATNTSFEMDVKKEVFNMLINDVATEITREVLAKEGIDFKEDDASLRGSSDIGNTSWLCPALHPMLAVSKDYFALHTRRMHEEMASKSIEDTIIKGARVLAGVILALLEDENRLKELRAEFERKSTAL